MTVNNLLTASELSAGYGREVVVGGVKLEVKAGEILCLIGPNGSGKSTILKTLTRELETLGGKIFVLGKDAERLSERGKGTVSPQRVERPEHGRLQRAFRLFRRGLQPQRGRGTNQDPHAPICQAADDVVEERHKLSVDYAGRF